MRWFDTKADVSMHTKCELYMCTVTRVLRKWYLATQTLTHICILTRTHAGTCTHTHTIYTQHERQS